MDDEDDTSGSRLQIDMRRAFPRWSSVRPLRGVTPTLCRLIYAVLGGNLLYVLLLLNFEIFEESLGIYAYSIATNSDKVLPTTILIAGVGSALALWVPHHRSIVGLFSHIIFTVLFIPLCAVYVLSDGSSLFIISCGSALAFVFFIYGRRIEDQLGRMPTLDRYIMLFFLGISIAVIINMSAYGNIKFSFLNFRDVYNLRTDAQFDDSASAGRVITIVAYSCSSFLLIYGILYRNITIFIYSCVLSYILYVSFGFKLFLFFPIITILLYIYYIYMKSYSIIFIIIFIMFVIYMDNILEINSSMLDIAGQLIVRRYFYVPGYLAFAWHDTFANGPFVYLSNVFIINKFSTYPFDISYPSVVSETIFGMNFNPNTSIIGYGFANFGYYGIFIYIFVTYISINVIDSRSRILNNAYIRFGSMSPSMLFLESDIFSVFISFGFLLIIMICLIAEFMLRRSRVGYFSST